MRLPKLRTTKRRPLLAVAGCMVGRYGMRELAKEMPEVGFVAANRKNASFGRKCFQQALGRSSEQAGSRIISTPKSYAWLKIAEGCGHDCAFCIIPKIRGPLVSTPSDLLLEEARQIAATGVRELDLIAQDCAAYGEDLGGDESLPDLLRKLSAIDGFAWITPALSLSRRHQPQLAGNNEGPGAEGAALPGYPHCSIRIRTCWAQWAGHLHWTPGA